MHIVMGMDIASASITTMVIDETYYMTLPNTTNLKSTLVDVRQDDRLVPEEDLPIVRLV